MQQEILEQQAQLVIQVQQEQRVQLAQQEIQERQAIQELQARQEQRVPQVILVRKAFKATRSFSSWR